MSKFRGQVTVDDADVTERTEDNAITNRSRRVQSVGGGSPLIKKSNLGRRKSQSIHRNVTIKTSLSTVPTPSLNRNDMVSASSSNDVILHVGGSAWTRESIAYGGSRDNTRPTSAHDNSGNIQMIHLQHRKSLDQSSLISPTTSIINQQIPSLRPTTADSLIDPRSPIVQTKITGDYVHSKAEANLPFTQGADNILTHMYADKYVDGQSDKNVSVELVQNAFKEYKTDINQSLSNLDTKINRLESMIATLVERIPAMPHTSLNNSAEENKNNISDPNKKT